jgi:dihydrofolate reductase
VDLEVPEGVTAYYAKEQVGGSHIRMYSITTIPANEGVVIKGTVSATVKFPIIANADALPADNLMKAHLNTEAVTPEDGNSVFVMATKNGETGFYPLSKENNVIGGHKSYLEIPATSAARLSIVWDDTETGIFETDGGEQNAEIYDLTGRRLDKPVKGINIIGGKLVIK